MALHKLVRRNYRGESLVSIKNQNPYFFKEGVIILRQSIRDAIIISQIRGSAVFTISLIDVKYNILWVS